MADKVFSELVAGAQVGDKEDLDKLTQLAGPRLRAYIYRITFDNELTDELVQETTYQMVASLRSLKEPDSFWAWLFKIASTRANSVFRRRRRRRELLFSAMDENLLQKCLEDSSDGSSERLAQDELGLLVTEAVSKLPLEQRQVVSLRCFEDMRYSEIAQVLGCTEIRVRVCFFRAKHSLKRHLKRNGVSKDTLLAGLILFGKLTAPSEAAAVATTVTSQALVGIGAGATIIGIAKSPWAKISSVIAGLLTVALCWAFWPAALPDRLDVRFIHFVQQGVFSANVTSSSSTDDPPESAPEEVLETKGAYETWMHLPEGPDGPLIRRDQRWDLEMTTKLCSWLQDGSANYYYNAGNNTVYITNNPLRALLLPTDTEQFCDFINHQRDYDPDIKNSYDKNTGLLVSRIDNRVPKVKDYKTLYNYGSLDESVFKYAWPKGTKVVDQQDRMHKRGWTYFRIKGRIGDREISGRGRIPFSYNMSATYSPWLELRIGKEFRIVDAASGSYLLNAGGKVLKAYPPGSFFKGLLRPWMGIGVYDSVRRDAAEKGIAFSSWPDSSHERDTVVLYRDDNQSHSNLVYNIDLTRDIIDSLEFDLSSRYESIRGRIEFAYLDQVNGLAEQFAEPELKGLAGQPHSQGPGIIWLFGLISGDFSD